jgi:threonine dehydrogenase-like Zn-dependent dehydrogenase
MKAVQFDRPGNVIITEMPLPGLAPGEVLLRVRYVGFCGSDLNTYLGRNPMVTYPRIPGHEISGTIAQLGGGIPEDLAVGDPVTVVPYTSCGQCPSCRKGRSHACQFNQTMGVQRNGAMCEFIAVPWQKVLKAPELGVMELAMVEPLTVGFHAIDRGRVTGSDVVVVLGCGMIAAGAIIRSVSKGAAVIAVDIDDRKLQTAEALGAGHLINSRNSDLHKELAQITDGSGPDVVVEAAGKPETYRDAVEEAAFAGRIVCIGYTGTEVSLKTEHFVRKELDIMGSRNATPGDFEAVISYLGKGLFPMERIITATIRPGEAREALNEWANDPGSTMKLMLDLT